MRRTHGNLLIALVLAGCTGTEAREASLGESPPRQSVRSPSDVPSNAVADTPLPAEIRLEDLLDRARSANPEIAAARAEAHASDGAVRQAGLYPNPRLSLEAEEIPVRDFGLHESENTVALTQTILLGGVRASGVEAARAERERRLAAVEHVRLRILSEVRAAFVELLYLRRADAMYAELLRVAGETLDVARDRVEARAAPEFEMLQPEVEVRNLEIARAGILRELAAVAADLGALLGGEEIPVECVVGSLEAEGEFLAPASWEERIRKGHPGLRAARAGIEAAVAHEREARARRVPDLEVRVAYGRDNAADENIVEAGVSVPLPVFNRSQGEIAQARALANRARREAEAIERRLFAEASAAFAAHEAASQAVEALASRVLPAAARALDQTRDGYRAGRRGLLDVLDAQRTLANARLAHLDALAEQARVATRFRRIVDFEWVKDTGAPQPRLDARKVDRP